MSEVMNVGVMNVGQSDGPAGKGSDGGLIKFPISFAWTSKLLMIFQKYFQVHIFAFSKYSGNKKIIQWYLRNYSSGASVN